MAESTQERMRRQNVETVRKLVSQGRTLQEIMEMEPHLADAVREVSGVPLDRIDVTPPSVPPDIGIALVEIQGQEGGSGAIGDPLQDEAVPA